MSVLYQTNLATSDLQDLGNQSLANILTAVQAIDTDSTTQITALLAIQASLSNVATATNQTTANTTLASILSALAPIATASKQDTQTTALNSIVSKLTAPSSATITSITQSSVSQTVLASNPNRKGLYLYNDTGTKIYIAYAATASSSAFTLILAPNAGQEINSSKLYTGVISAVWASGTSANKLQITEVS